MNISDPAFHPGALVLPESEVQVWRLDLEALAAAEDRWHKLLSPDEQARAGRFRPVQVRRHFVVARGMLRTVLAAYLGVDASKLAFCYSAREKPRLAPPYAESGILFNVAHSGGVALLAFAREREIGVDVEQMSREVEVAAIARRFFSPREQVQLAALSPEERHDAFFRCWTRKEAFIKAKGEGLALPLDQFDVSIAPGDKNALLATRPDEAEAARWSLREVQAGPGYAGALCVGGHEYEVRD